MYSTEIYYRSCDLLLLQQHNLAFALQKLQAIGYQSFGPSSESEPFCIAWNKLLHDIQDSPPLNILKWKLKEYCFKQAFNF